MSINKNQLFNNKSPKMVEQNINDISRISQGTAIRGDLTSAADIRVDGRVDGTLFSEGKVVIGESARLSGKLLCSNVDFWGKMDGDVYVKDLLSLKSSAVVNGNIHVRKIQVEMGAQINGSFKMINEQEYDQLVASMVHKPEPVAAPKPASRPFAAKLTPKPAPASEPKPAVIPEPKSVTPPQAS